jgi:hypothetical protein
MYMKYDRNKFLKFFNQEYILENEAQIFKYCLSTDKFIFSLFISVYDNLAVVRSTINQNSQVIFDIAMKNITKITCNETSLFFYQGNESEIDLSKPDYTVVVKPKPAIDWEIDNFYKFSD